MKDNSTHFHNQDTLLAGVLATVLSNLTNVNRKSHHQLKNACELHIEYLYREECCADLPET